MTENLETLLKTKIIRGGKPGNMCKKTIIRGGEPGKSVKTKLFVPGKFAKCSKKQDEYPDFVDSNSEKEYIGKR